MESTDEKHPRKVHRSPGYPVCDLGEAIEKAEAVYKNEKRSATTPEVLAAHMGYSQANGPGGRAVSALRQYGLIEEANGKYRISDLGFTLVHYDRQSSEWKSAAADAALRPTLMKEFRAEYPDGLPSDATMRNDLLNRGFNPAAISDVVSIVRNTLALAEPNVVVHTEVEGETEKPDPKKKDASEERVKLESERSRKPMPKDSGMRQDVFSLAEGDITIQWPTTISPESFQDVADWLQILERKIKRSVSQEPTPISIQVGDALALKG